MIMELNLAASNNPSELSGFYLSLIGHAPFAMALVEGISHNVCYVNTAFCRLLDKSKEQLIQRSIAELLPEQDECVALLDRVLCTGVPESYTEQEPVKRHRLIWSYVTWPVMRGEHPVGVMIQVNETVQSHDKTLAINEALLLGSLRQHELTEAANSANRQLQAEICERKQAEEALRQAQAQLRNRAGQLESLVSERTSELKATNDQMEAFVYSIAHDLRAPLRAMQGFSALLLEESAATLNATGQDYALRINKSAQFMDALLRDLLEFSRISQQNVKLTSINLRPVVDSVLARLQHDIQEKHATVENAGPWPMVLAHEPTLAQALFNLASNALKFTAPNVPPRIRLWTDDQTNFIRVNVADSGIGIALDHQTEIFRLFARLGGKHYSGTGIGLAIVQKGVERMGGRVGVESMPGQGSRFWFELRKSP